MAFENRSHRSPLRRVTLLEELLNDIYEREELNSASSKRSGRVGNDEEREKNEQFAKTSVESWSMLGKISWKTIAFSSSVAKSSFV